MLLKVTKQYARGNDVGIAQFSDINDARMFIKIKLAEDARVKVKVVYRIFEGMDMLEEFQPSDAIGGGSAGSSGSGAGAQQKSNFQPTPFSTAARPPGVPAHWGREDEDK